MTIQIKLGDHVVDKITGFKGVAIAKLEFLNGCVRFGVQPEKLEKGGGMAEALYLDVQQLEPGKGKNFFERHPANGVAVLGPPGGPPCRIHEPNPRG